MATGVSSSTFNKSISKIFLGVSTSISGTVTEFFAGALKQFFAIADKVLSYSVQQDTQVSYDVIIDLPISYIVIEDKPVS